MEAGDASPRAIHVSGVVSATTGAQDGRHEKVRPLKETLGGCAITRTFNAAALDAGRSRLDIALVALG